MVPIFKQGANADIRNYRPIITQPTLAKLFEKIIQEHFYFHLNKYIDKEQHDFRIGHSTMTKSFYHSGIYYVLFFNSCSVNCAYLDFAKAFDKVFFQILIAKHKAYEVTGTLLRWLKSYFMERFLIVKFDKATLMLFPVSSGVLQDSHLGPIPYILFINDIGKVLGQIWE